MAEDRGHVTQRDHLSPARLDGDIADDSPLAVGFALHR